MTDKEKFNLLYARIRDFDFPKFQDPEYQELCNEIKEGFQIILEGIKKGAENLRKS